jgi:hypothetical protein
VYSPGDQLASTVTLVSNQVVGNVRTVVMSRPMIGATADHYTFGQNITMNFIAAVGSSQEFAYHAAHDVSIITTTTVGVPTCICDIEAVGLLCNTDGSGCQQFVKDCVPAPDGDLLTQNNPTCNSMHYVGGLQCCGHMRILLDADQDPGNETLRYHFKMRVW